MSQTRAQLVSPVGVLTASGISVTGVVTASSFSGNLTGTATGLTGTPDIAINNITGVAATFTGNVSIAGTLTYEDVTNVDSLGLGTFRSGVEVFTGTATTALIVEGDARITGILTIGTSSITLDGSNNIVNVGTGVTLDGTAGEIRASSLNIGGQSVSSLGIGIGTTGGIVGYGATLINLYGPGVSTAYYDSNVGIATIYFEGGGSGGATNGYVAGLTAFLN